MIERQRRWYAPEVRAWRGDAVSRDRAFRSGGFSAFLAVWFGAITFFTDHGPVVATLQWLCICGLIFEAYRNFAHAAFNTTRETERLEDGP